MKSHLTISPFSVGARRRCCLIFESASVIPAGLLGHQGSRGSGGLTLDYLKQLLAYWADHFDWSAQERAINAFHHFRAELDGAQIHFVHERARYGEGIPLILSHGWPSTFVELLPLAPLLTDPRAHGIDGPPST